MGKLNLVIEDVPVLKRPGALKNLDLYQEVVETFESLPIGKSFVVPNDSLPSSTLEAKIRKMVTLKAGERLKVSRIVADGKLTGVRLSKIAEPKPKSQGEVQEAQGNG